MDALTFLKTILPEDGYKFVGLSRAGSSGIAHKAYESLELMAEAIASYDKQTNLTVYHACAAYKEPSYEAIVNGEAKKKYRGEPNWFKAKSFWADIDCGEDKAAEGKGYPDKKSAATAIVGFCRANGFPDPMLVDSGGGIHCYWPLTPVLVRIAGEVWPAASKLPWLGLVFLSTQLVLRTYPLCCALWVAITENQIVMYAKLRSYELVQQSTLKIFTRQFKQLSLSTTLFHNNQSVVLPLLA